MNAFEILKTLVKPDPFILQKEASFRPGQIISGKITALFPNQMAEVQAGSKKFIAQLEVPLSVNERYWFQVQPGEGKIHLKLVTQENSSGGRLPSEPLLSKFGLTPTKENRQLLEFAIRNRLPISKEIIEQGSLWLKELKMEAPGLEAIKLMVEKELPFTKSVFFALLSAQDQEPIHSVMDRLLTLLKNDTVNSETGKLLQEVLKNILGEKRTADPVSGDLSQLPNDWKNGETISRQIKHLIKTMGLDYEGELVQNGIKQFDREQEHMLKPLLIRFLNETHDSEQKNAGEQLLNRVTAVQLLSSDNGMIQQLVAQIPLPIPNISKEAMIQWNGRKQENGKIDPNYCRILFYLDLAAMGDTFVDVQIQNRIMSVAVVNECEELTVISQPLIKSLREKLQALDYHLTSLSFAKPPEQQPIAELITKTAFPAGNSHYQGVDFRI